MKKRTVFWGILTACTLLFAACGGEAGQSVSSAVSGADSAKTETASEPAQDKSQDEASTAVSGYEEDLTIGEENREVEPIDINIVFSCWGYADSLSMGYQKALNSISKGLLTLEQPVRVNWEWISCYSPEEELTAMEAIHAKGIDGAILLYLSEAVIDNLTSWEIPFAGYTTYTEEVEAYAQKSPYYVGTIHEAIPDQAERQIRYAIETLGRKEILIVGSEPGQTMVDIRFPRYEAVEAEHPEIAFYTNRSDEILSDVVNNMLSMHPDIDYIIDTSALGGRGDSIVQALRTNGLGHGEIAYITCDFVDDQVQAMEDGLLVFTSSGTQGSVTHAFVALLNEIMDTPLYDNPAVWEWGFVDIVTVEDYDNFNKYCIGRVPLISFEEYEPFFKWIHPEADGAAFSALCENLELDTIMEKHAKYFE